MQYSVYVLKHIHKRKRNISDINSLFKIRHTVEALYGYGRCKYIVCKTIVRFCIHISMSTKRYYIFGQCTENYCRTHGKLS